MISALIELGIFTSKALILFVFIAAILILFFMLLAKAKGKMKGHLTIKNINDTYKQHSEELLAEILPKKQFKAHLKEQKVKESKQPNELPHLFVVRFVGDIKASAVESLREEITAIINIARPGDEVLLVLDSAGGIVHGYGLAAAQLLRLRNHRIPLTIAIDKIAASGGYMMACVADKIIASPFAIIGSIGVIVQLPNFHRLLKDKRIDFEQHTAGEFKRTITVFGENTNAGREKLQEEIEVIHQQFKKWITDFRPQININQVATGEHWLGNEAVALKLVDEIKTSDDFILTKTNSMKAYEITYEIKKPFLARLTGAAAQLRDNVWEWAR